MHHPTDRIAHTTAFVTPVLEHWLEREIAQWVHSMKDRSDDPSHHEQTLLPQSYISLLPGTTPCSQDKCKTCPSIRTSVEVQGPKYSMNVKNKIQLPYKIDYVIRCTKCAKLYIGETGRTLDTRFR